MTSFCCQAYVGVELQEEPTYQWRDMRRRGRNSFTTRQPAQQHEDHPPLIVKFDDMPLIVALLIIVVWIECIPSMLSALGSLV
jgi:hypothetical protein